MCDETYKSNMPFLSEGRRAAAGGSLYLGRGPGEDLMQGGGQGEALGAIGTLAPGLNHWAP